VNIYDNIDNNYRQKAGSVNGAINRLITSDTMTGLAHQDGALLLQEPQLLVPIGRR
jgi:hypothetical protein